MQQHSSNRQQRHDDVVAHERRRNYCLSTLELLYRDRRLPSTKVFPAVVPPGRRVEVALSSSLDIVCKEKKARFTEKVLKEKYPKGAFIRGRVLSVEGDSYDVSCDDGPYGVDDSYAPPPGYLERKNCCLKDRVILKKTEKDFILKKVPLKSLVVVDEEENLHVPWAVILLTVIQVACHLAWRRSFTFERTARSRKRPGSRRFYFNLVGPFPNCQDGRREVYRLWTYQFVHISWSHVLSNAFVACVFGSAVEVTHGGRVVLCVHQCGVVAGALCCVLADPYDAVVGSSGGTYAVIAATLGNVYKDWHRLEPNGHTFLDRRKRLLILFLIISADLASWYFTRDPSVSYAAHVGGAIVGLLSGILFLRRRPHRKRSNWTTRRKIVFVIAALLFLSLFLSGFLWYTLVWPPQPLTHRWYDQRNRKYRPCCIQLFDCGIMDANDSLLCNFDKKNRQFAISKRNFPYTQLDTCDQLKEEGQRR